MRAMRIPLFAVLLLVSISASAQNATDLAHRRNVKPDAYGTAATTMVTIGATQFAPELGTEAISGGISGEPSLLFARHISNTACCMDANVDLPTGVLLTRWELVGCDSSASADLGGNFIGVPPAAAQITLIGDPIVTSGTPGCGVYGADINPPIAVDHNANAAYVIQVSNGNDGSGAVALLAARVYYKRQVSPDPATATFSDVPVGAPFHRFVEALAAAGITGGCGNGKYCPNDPVTRGQMAVFISTALGLHFPN